MRRVLATSVLVGAGLFATACSDQRSPLPTEPPPLSPSLTGRSCPSPLQLAALTFALFTPGDLLTFARSTQNNINLKMSRGDIAGARKLALAFIDFTLQSYYQGKLRDPNGANPPTTAEAVLTLIDGILCWVGLPPSGIQLATTGADVTVTTKVIGPGGDQFKSTDELSGLKVPPGAVSEDRLWVITRRDDLANAGTCVSTTLTSQIPLCIDFSVVPAQDVAKPLVVAICQPELNQPPDRRLAHKLTDGKIELLAVTVDPFPLVCTSTPDFHPPGLGRVGRAVWKVGSFMAQVLGPKRLHATHSGLGGLLGPKLSPVTAVRVRLNFEVQPTNTAPGHAITPAVQVAFRDFETAALATEVTNQIKMSIGVNPGAATLGGDTIQTPSNGIATFANLTIGNSATGYTLVADALSSTFTGDSLIHTPVTSNAFDITENNTWTSKASMPTARYAFGTGVVSDTLYAVGGFNGSCCLSTLEAYYPVANTWTAKAPMPTPRYIFATGVVNGMIYAVGGQNNSSSTLTTVEAYNPGSGTWTTKASLPTGTGSNGPAAGAVNGILYVVGGFNSGVYLGTVQAYDPTTDTWTTKSPMPTARAYLGVSVVNGVLYAIGGRTSGPLDLGTVEAYDPLADAWTTKASMPTARAGLRTGVVGGLIYAVASDGVTNTVEAYDPVANSWSSKPSLPTARGVPGVEGVNGLLYVVGGAGGGGVFLTTNEAYHP